jgi:hypothetical protein
VPRDDGIEALVERRVGIHAVQADAVAELAQRRDRALALARVEVVEVAVRHQEVRGGDAALLLAHRHGQSCVERHIDVVAEKDVAGPRLVVEKGPAVAAVACRVEQLDVVVEVELTGHSTSTSTSAAAASARASASGPVSPVAIT